jgi:hypothetical protein
MATRKVDDAQPSHANTNIGFEVVPGVVGSTMIDAVRHSL